MFGIRYQVVESGISTQMKSADGTRMERRWNADGTPIDHGWNSDGMEMERRWNLSGSSIALNVASIGAFFTKQRSHELPRGNSWDLFLVKNCCLFGHLRSISWFQYLIYIHDYGSLFLSLIHI